jgi:hypothetical protein
MFGTKKKLILKNMKCPKMSFKNLNISNIDHVRTTHVAASSD